MVIILIRNSQNSIGKSLGFDITAAGLQAFSMRVTGGVGAWGAPV